MMYCSSSAQAPTAVTSAQHELCIHSILYVYKEKPRMLCVYVCACLCMHCVYMRVFKSVSLHKFRDTGARVL